MAETKSPQKNKQIKKDRKLTKRQKIIRKIAIIFGCLLGFGFVVLGFVFYVDAYSNKILPNVRLGNVSVSNLILKEAQNRIFDLTQKVVAGDLTLKIDDQEQKETMQTLGLQYDSDASVEMAYNYGHSGDYWQRSWDALKALVNVRKFDPIVTDGMDQIEQWLSNVASKVDNPVQQANIEVQNGQANIIEPKDGQEINQKITLARINKDILKLQNPFLELKRETIHPDITKDDAEKLKEKAIELTSQTLKLKASGDVFNVYPNSLGKWIQLKNNNGDVYVSFNQDKIKEYLNDIASSVGISPVDAKFIYTDSGLRVIRSSASGKSLNIDEAATQIIALLDKNNSREMDLPLEEQKAKISEELVQNIAKYGIKEKIGSATTSFGNSPANRIHNIKTGVQFLNGIVIAPGQEFSTIGYLGKIDGSTGYLPELVIKEDKTVPEFGGGLCQVSTTLFRAAMQSGLKISERKNHAYRVSYYEPPVGMDATIYSPQPDLRFVNNTPAYILVQGGVSGNHVTFDFYGTSDGRHVSLTDPEIYDITPPGDIIYIDDPSLGPGEVKQIERAHAGAKAKFHYKVYNSNGGLKFGQTFISSYVPWPARYLKGPDKPPEDNPSADQSQPTQ